MFNRLFGLLTPYLLLLCVSVSLPAHAALTIEITQRLSEATPIAVVPFGGVQTADNTGNIIAADLDRSGTFNVIERSKLPSLPSSSAEILPSIWQGVPADFIVVGSVSRLPDGRLSYRYELLKRGGLERALGETFTVDAGRSRDAAHYIADKIYKQVTGEPGIFATKILYVNQYMTSMVLGKSHC